MLTPSQLATAPNVKNLVLPEYDFVRQSRGCGLEMSYTYHSVQTFDGNGKPYDAKDDNND